MGGVNSTRTITLVNDDKAGVIQLSDGLVHRLKDQIEKDTGSKNTEENQNEEQPPPPSQPQISTISLPEVDTQQGIQLPPQSGQWLPYSGDAQLVAAKMREQKHNELRAVDRKWRKKIQEREEEYAKLHELREENIQASIREVESFFMKVSQQPVCQNQSDSVLSCYKLNGKQPLRCAQQVDAMARCADLSRLKSAS